tara:strand:- start:363 stop:590 length:228 start_codon:yes stop_codon:yes gene_type:complete
MGKRKEYKMMYGNNEIQTYTMSKALSFYEQGYEVYIAHPLDEDDNLVDDLDKMNSEEEIIEGDGHLFIIKERNTK